MLGIAALAQLPLAGFPTRAVTPTPPTPTRRVGWGGRRRHDPEELERRLKEQQANTFGRQWYADYLAAQQAVIDRAKTAKSEKQKEVLIEAVAAAQEAVAPDENITRLLQAAADAGRATASIKRAQAVIDWIGPDDDEEAIEILLCGGEIDSRPADDDEEAIELLLYH